MRSLTILPVGNGACSIIRQSSGIHLTGVRATTSIVDCGRGSGGGRKAAAYLEAELSSRDWDALESLVVTHWDADHWNGLRYFANNTPRPVLARKRKLTLYSPAIPFGIPRLLPASVCALITATSASGVEAIDFTQAWRKHFDVERIPVAQGDTIELAGSPYEVEWPPRNLVGTVIDRAASILAEIGALAKSNPRFGKVLDEAYSRMNNGAFGTVEGGDNAEAVKWDELRGVSDCEEVDLVAMTDSGNDVEEETNGMAEVSFDEASPSSGARSGKSVLNKAEHGALIAKARKLQNDLSLVFHDRESKSLIVYGDAPEKVVGVLSPRLERFYGVQLAPHHGTHSMPRNAPFSLICVAQCSLEQRALWRKHARDTLVDVAICDFEPEGLRLPLNCWPW